MNFGLAAGGAGLLGGVPLVTSLLESGVNAYSQHQTNKSNERIANEANASSARQAQEQMAFQERMSNTSYQRAMDDMKKAGLNPILAYSQGGASAPSGAMGDVKAAKLDPINISGLTSSAVSAANTALQMRRDDSSIALQDVQTTGAKASAMKTVADTEKTRVETQNAIDLAKRQAEIHQQTASARRYQKMQADLDASYVTQDRINRSIQNSAQSVESIGDAIYSLLPGGKILKNLFGRGASSAKDLQTAPSRLGTRGNPEKVYIDKKTGEILE